jgi:DamX protein
MLMTAAQLLKVVYAGFADHFTPPSNETTFGPLLKFSHDVAKKGRSALILIDNAQELNTDAVSMLLDMMSLATDNQTVPHVVLFSESPISRNLDAYQRSRYEQLSHSFTLAPYSLEQTRAYLLHRVRAVGGGINLPFNEKQILQIYQESAGYPGKINQVAQKIMGIGDKSKKSGMRFNLAMGFPLAHMGLLSVVMLGILVAVLFSDKPEEAAVTSRTNNVIPLSPRQGQSSPETIARIDAMQRKIGQDGDVILPSISTGTSLPAISMSKSLTPAQTSTNSPTMTESLVQSAPIRSETSLLEAAPVVETPAPTVKKIEKITTVTVDPFDKTQWWLSQNPNRYTLQLLGTHNISAVKDFIRAQGGVDAFGYFKSKHNDKDWFVVVYGTYRNRSEAIAAAETLPSDIRALNPWARSARGIQEDINKSQ